MLDRHILSEPALGEWGVLKPLKEAPRCTVTFSAVLSWVGHAVKRNTAALFDGFSRQENEELAWVKKWVTTSSLAGTSLQRAWKPYVRWGAENFKAPPVIGLDFILPFINTKEVFFLHWKMHESSLTQKHFGLVPSLDFHSQSLITSQDKFNNLWLLFYSMLTKSHLDSGETSIKATEIQNIHHIRDCNTFLLFPDDFVGLSTLLDLTTSLQECFNFQTDSCTCHSH